jgi:hypothetical protein
MRIFRNKAIIETAPTSLNNSVCPKGLISVILTVINMTKHHGGENPAGRFR